MREDLEEVLEINKRLVDIHVEAEKQTSKFIEFFNRIGRKLPLAVRIWGSTLANYLLMVALKFQRIRISPSVTKQFLDS